MPGQSRSYTYDNADNMRMNTGLCTGNAMSYTSAVPGAVPLVILSDVYAAQLGESQSTTYTSPAGTSYPATNASDGNPATVNHTQAAAGVKQWLKLDLQDLFVVTEVKVTNINSATTAARLNGAVVKVLNGAGTAVYTSAPITGATAGEVFTFTLPAAVWGRAVLIEGAAGQYLHVAEVEFSGTAPTRSELTATYAAQVSETQSTTLNETTLGADGLPAYGAPRANDSNTSTFNHTLGGADEWLRFDLRDSFYVARVVVRNRINTTTGVAERLNGAVVKVLNAQGTTVYTSPAITGATSGESFAYIMPSPLSARFVRLEGAANQYLHVGEVDVVGLTPTPESTALRPHAPASICGVAVSYDANGNRFGT